ncbi:MAG TPA: BatA domain-containing protein [Candidatus Angelobacter sp.]|nr:BatA domain-containing protein [Candidatus Angelobacter sp.]
MSFLAPAFLLGALAVALPVVFHLIRRTSKEKMTFSSLMFLQPTLPRLTRRNRLENIFLLFLRCLVLCFLALGFARPFFQKPMVNDPQAAAGQKIVLLVDTSASMRRQNLWSLALAKAEEILRNTSPADQVAVFTFDQRARLLAGFDQWTAMNAGERAALTGKQLAGLKPGWASTHLGSALLTAAEFFADTDPQGRTASVRRIVLITDLQEGSRLDGLQGYDWPRGIEVSIEPVKAALPTNAGLQWVVDAEDSAQAADPGVRVRVLNASGSRREQFQIRWEGVTGAAPLDVYVPPGQSRIVPEPALSTNAAADRLTLTGDDDDFDNALYLVQPKPERVNVLFLGDDAENDPAQMLYYVKRAFQQTRRQVVGVVALSAKLPLAASDAAGVTFVIVTGSLPRAQLEIVKKMLHDGVTVLVVMRDAREGEALSELAGASISCSEAQASGYAMFGQIDFEDPLFAPFADPRFSDFTKIHFWKHRRLDTGQLSRARTVARFDNGDAALVEILADKGRLFVLASGWQPSDSQLALSSKFVPLLYSMLELSGGVRSKLAQYHVGDEVDLAPLKSAQPLIVRKPDGSEVRLAIGEARFVQTELPGIYTVTSQQPLARFAVNLDASESRTAPLPVEEFMRLGVPMKMQEVEVAKQADQKRRLHNAELENQQKLWRWLIVASLVVLLMETCLAGWLTRRATNEAAI